MEADELLQHPSVTRNDTRRTEKGAVGTKVFGVDYWH